MGVKLQNSHPSATIVIPWDMGNSSTLEKLVFD